MRHLACLGLVIMLGGWSDVPSGRKTAPADPKDQQAAPAEQPQSATPSIRLADGRFLVVGEPDRTPGTSGAWLIDPTTGARDAIAATELPRVGHTLTLLPDGRVLVVGGWAASDRLLDTPIIFDPVGRAFEPQVEVSLAPREAHTVTLLSDGRVLIAGGIGGDGMAIEDAELWNPSSDAAPQIVRMQWGHRDHRATLLADGSVRLDDADGRHSEWFEPASGQFVTRRDTDEEATRALLVDSLPANGAVDVALDARIALHFSRPLDVTSVADATIQLTNETGAYPLKIVPAEGGRLVFLAPVGSWQAGTTYHLRIEGLRDDQRRAVGAAPWSFATRPDPDGSRDTSIDDPGWTPDADGLRRGWRTGRQQSSWEQLALLQAPRGRTALSGRVLRLDGQPLPHVRFEMEGHEIASDRTGRFLLDLAGVGTGRHELVIDGTLAGRRGQTYGTFEVGLHITASRTNPLTFTIWMPKVDTEHAVRIPSPTTQETVITTPRIPGLELRLPAGTVIRDVRGRVVREVSLTPIPLDRPPFPLPKNVDVPIYFTAQPGAAYVYTQGQPARVIYPNRRGAPSGRRMAFWHYDPEERGWYVYGHGQVSADRRQIVPDPGVGIYQFTGAMVAPPSLAPPEGPRDHTEDGDPVNLSTGLVTVTKTDLVVPDVIPLTLRRTYRPGDTLIHAFGMGATHEYDVFLVGDYYEYSYMDLVMPDGERIHYPRISPGTGYFDAVYESTDRQTGLFKSRIAHSQTSAEWILTLKTGAVWTFPESDAATVSQQAAVRKVQDRHGNVLTFTRNSAGDLIRITSPNGRWIQFTYDASHRITQARDGFGARAVSYTYDAAGHLWKVTDVTGGLAEYTYDALDRLLTIKDARGIVVVTNEYDTSGRVTRQMQADGTTYQFAYTLDTWGDVVQTDVTDPKGVVRRLTFDADGYVSTMTRALGRPEEWTITYERESGTHLMTAVSDALGRRTDMTYDSMGNMTSLARLAGTSDVATTSATYHAVLQLPTTVTDPLGHTTVFTYNPTTGDLIDIQDHLQHHLAFTYDASGQILSTTDALNQTTTYSYDTGDLTSSTTPLQHTWRRFVDGAGRVTAITDPLGRATTFEYDASGRVTRTVDPVGGEIARTYDPNGNLLSVTDPLGHTTAYAYDAMDRLVSRTDPLLREASYQYDPNGNLAVITDRAAQVAAITYDGLNRPTQVTDAAGTTSYTWDAGNRLTQVVDSNGGTVTRTYDLRNQLTSETTGQGTVTYGYDAAGRRTSMTVTGQPSVAYEYDDVNRLTGITQGPAVATLAYDSSGRPTSVTLPNGIVMTYSYDADSNVTGISYTLGASTMGTLTYAYDDAGRRVSVGGTYGRANLPSALTSASYDGANQLTQWGGASLNYDANGHLLSDGSRTFTWNARGQLTASSGTGMATFAYDGLGRRASRTISGAATSYLYDRLNVVQELDAGVPTANILTGLGLDAVLTRTDGSGAHSMMIDALGSTVALANDAGVVQTEYTYAPFGATSSVGGVNDSTQFTGRENDHTGLYFYRARYYDPLLQRFLSEDPVGFRGGDLNLYAYVGNSPIQSVDPLGLYKRDVHYDLTRGIAQQVGICASEADTIAMYDQYVDDNVLTTPMPPFGDGYTREMWHFASRERLEALRREAFETGNPADLGAYLHALQDTFSHQLGRNDRTGEPYGKDWGHAWDSLFVEDPDNPRNRPNLWRRMIQETTQELWRWQQVHPQCDPFFERQWR